jgi:hypothetical protein
MIAKVLHTFTVRNYAELYQMYKNKELGIIEQRMPDDIVEQVAGEDGTDEELILNLLTQDPDNIYHVHFEDDSEDGYFVISYMGFGLNKKFNEMVSEYDFNFGEDGIWEEYRVLFEEDFKDASVIGVLTIYCDDRVEVKK